MLDARDLFNLLVDSTVEEFIIEKKEYEDAYKDFLDPTLCENTYNRHSDILLLAHHAAVDLPNDDEN